MKIRKEKKIREVRLMKPSRAELSWEGLDGGAKREKENKTETEEGKKSKKGKEVEKR